MQTKNLYELSYEELRVECQKRGVKLRGDQGDSNMVEAVVALTKKLLMDGRDPIKEEFHTSEGVSESATDGNNAIIQEAVVALTKKLLVEGLDPIKEDDDKMARKRTQTQQIKSPRTGPGVIVAKSECESSSKTRPETNAMKTQCKSAQVLFPTISSTVSSSTHSFCHPPTTHAHHTNRTRSISGTLPTLSSPGVDPSLLSNSHLIQFKNQRSRNQQSNIAEEDSFKDDNKRHGCKKKEKSADSWLANLHKGLDKIFFPKGCQL